MKTTTLLTIAIVIGLASCSPSTGIVPVESEIPASTFTPSPTLPPTLTPIPTSAAALSTPTALYMPVELSAADNGVYQKALSDIALYRQGNIQVTVQDENGNPLTGYQVEYRQTSHDFLFGGVADPSYYTALRKTGINTNTAFMYREWIQLDRGKFQLDFPNYWLGLDELKSGGMNLKTSNLFNFGGDDFPPYLKNLSIDDFLIGVYDLVSTTVKRFAPSVDYWEAILEPDRSRVNPLALTKDEYYRAIATSTKAIRGNDPTATIEINLGIPCGRLDWLDSYQTAQELLAQNLDFDVVGLQFYYNAYIASGNYQMPRMSFAEMSGGYDMFAKLLVPHGRKIIGPEFSVPSEASAGQTGYWNIPWSEDTQAQYLTTAYTIFFAKPSNLGLIWWNTVDPSPFVYHGGLIRDDGALRKSYYALQELIKDWTTTGDGITDINGSMTFTGYGGEYELVIIHPANRASMVTKVQVTEQKSTSETMKFIPNNLLLEKRAVLEELVSYWESKDEQDLVQKGTDHLALVKHHIQNAEWGLAGQTLIAALDDLAIRIEVPISPEQLIPVGSHGTGFTVENGSVLIWGATTLHFPYDFPPGTVTVEIKAHSQNEKGESPIVVSGVGANYSQVWKVGNTQSDVYIYSVSSTGDEQDFTIRFPYDGRIYEHIASQNGDGGELKLYIDAVKLVIKTMEVP